MRQKLHRKFSSRGAVGKAAAAATAALLALSLAACSDSGENGGSDDGGSAETSDGGTLLIAQADQIMNLDPFTIPTGGRETRAPKRQIFDALVYQDDDFVAHPQLADSWDNPDENTWVFTLRDDVSFHNGEKFNAETVKENFDMIMDPSGGSPSHAKFESMIKDVEVTDEYTVTMTTIDPSPSLMTALAFQELVPTKHREEVGGEDFNKSPVGTGPFKFVSQSASEVVLERNDDYWGEVPQVDEVIFRHVPEVSARIASLQSGEVNIIDNVPGDLSDTLTGEAVPVNVDGTRVYFVGMNVEEAPFDDVNVRRAAVQATDTDSLAEFLYDGNAIALNQPAFPTMFGYQEDADTIDFDPEAAGSVLTEYSDSLTMYTKQSDLTLAQAVAGQWEDAGFTVSLQTLEDESFSTKIEAGELPLYVSSWGVAEGDLDALNTRHFWSERGADSAYTNYSSDEADKLIVEGRTTIDEDARMESYDSLIDLLIQDAMWVPLVTPGETYGTSQGLEGWAPTPTGQYFLNSVTVN